MKRTNQGHGAVCPLPPSAGYSLPWLAALARRGDELRVKKVQRIKKQLAQGIYHVKATEVVRGIARSEISWAWSPFVRSRLRSRPRRGTS